MMVQTEIGLLPEDWEVQTIGDVFKLSAAGDLRESLFSLGRSSLYCYPVYSNSIIHKGLYGYTSSPRYKRGCITITGRGTLGHAEYREIDFDAIIRLLILQPKIDINGYLITAFINKKKPFFFESTSIPQLTVPQIRDVFIPIPPKSEQQNIASALSCIDKLIDDLGRTIQKKQLIREGAMEELLSGKKRLPGFTEEWVEKPISYFGSFKGQSINPSTTPNEMYFEYSMPAYDEGMKPFLVKGADMLSSRTQIEGEVLLVNKLNVRQRRIWHIYNCEDNAICSGEFLPFKSTVIALDYLKQLLLTEKVVNDFIDLSTGTSNSQKRVTPKQILDYQITVPSDIHEQHAIADILTAMDDEISVLQIEKAKYEQIRSGMMEELLTGKKRLK